MRLIDVEALKHEILEICKYNCFTVIKPTSEQCNGCEIYDIYKKIIEAPTADAKPVIHAHWEKYDDSKCCYCSHCGKPAAEDDDVSWHGYCPICGAKMDESEDKNEIF